MKARFGERDGFRNAKTCAVGDIIFLIAEEA